MAGTDSMDCEPDRAHSNDLQDIRDQGVILVHVLTLYPAQLRLSELLREVVAGATDFDGADRFERAVTELVGVGLLHRSAELVLPTRAAVRFDQIVHAGV